MKFITRFFKQFFPNQEYQYLNEITIEELSEIAPIRVQDEVIERTDLYLRDYRYKIGMFYAENDLIKTQDQIPDQSPDSSPIPRHPRPFSS